MEHNEKVHRPRHKMIFENFLGGIAWALGVWVGATVIIAVLAFILSQINYVPIVGDFTVKVIDYVSANSLDIAK